MGQGRALVVGLARNIASSFEANIRVLAEAFSCFEELSFYLVESDSSDTTVEELARARDYIENFSYVSLGALVDKFPKRVERITFCRNSYLKYFLSKKADFDYLIVADMDGVNCGLTAESVASCWSTDLEWDAVFPNQSSLYYDIWALRHDAWCPGDCWKNYRFLKSVGQSDENALWQAVFSKMITIPIDYDWIPVRSAFGGLGIYKASSFPEAYYSCYDECGIEVCEHVNLHCSPGFNNRKLLINPALINGGLNGHSEKALLRNRIKRRLQKTEKKARNLRDRLGIGLKFGQIKRRLKQ
jgi:hypothetical protein